MNEPSTCLKVAACICAKDGVLSELEEKALAQCLKERFPEFTDEEFNQALIEFFESTDQIEDYLMLIEDRELRSFTLDLSERSASSDGLDIKENIALQKAYLLWGKDSRNTLKL